MSNDDNVQGLIDLIENSPDNFIHLQVFLSQDGKSILLQDCEYLMISHANFGLDGLLVKSLFHKERNIVMIIALLQSMKKN